MPRVCVQPHLSDPCTGFSSDHQTLPQQLPSEPRYIALSCALLSTLGSKNQETRAVLKTSTVVRLIYYYGTTGRA